jgi:hypothetical protein
MPSLVNIADLFKDIWDDLKTEKTASLSTFAYFLAFLILFVVVLAYSFTPPS